MSFLYNEFFPFFISVFVILSVVKKKIFEFVANALNKFITFFFSSSIVLDDFLFDMKAAKLNDVFV